MWAVVLMLMFVGSVSAQVAFYPEFRSAYVPHPYISNITYEVDYGPEYGKVFESEVYVDNSVTEYVGRRLFDSSRSFSVGAHDEAGALEGVLGVVAPAVLWSSLGNRHRRLDAMTADLLAFSADPTSLQQVYTNVNRTYHMPKWYPPGDVVNSWEFSNRPEDNGSTNYEGVGFGDLYVFENSFTGGEWVYQTNHYQVWASTSSAMRAQVWDMWSSLGNLRYDDYFIHADGSIDDKNHIGSVATSYWANVSGAGEIFARYGITNHYQEGNLYKRTNSDSVFRSITGRVDVAAVQLVPLVRTKIDRVSELHQWDELVFPYESSSAVWRERHDVDPVEYVSSEFRPTGRVVKVKANVTYNYRLKMGRRSDVNP